MRQTLLKLAANDLSKPLVNSPTFRSGPTSKLAAQLLSPIPLYRRLLRVHRKALPIEMRVMGDEYIKAEFRRTRSTDNALHIVGFLSEWKKYLDFHEDQVASNLIEQTGEEEGKGKKKEREGQKLQTELFEKLSADQMGQLYELLQATKEVWNPKTEDEESILAISQTMSNKVIPEGLVATVKVDNGEGGEGGKKE